MTSLPVPTTRARGHRRRRSTSAAHRDRGGGWSTSSPIGSKSLAELLTSDAGRLVLRNRIRGQLHQGTIATMKVIEYAEAGHQDADRALRELAIEMIGRREEMPTELANYVQRALDRAPTTSPQGRNIADTWLRDIGIAVMVNLAMERWHLLASRNRATRHPSASSVVATALRGRGLLMTEWQVATIFREYAPTWHSGCTHQCRMFDVYDTGLKRDYLDLRFR